VARDFPLLINVQACSGAHAAFYSVGTVVLSEHNVADAGSLPLTSILCQVKAGRRHSCAALYAVMVRTGTALRSPSGGCKFSFGGRAATEQLYAASCMESLRKMNVGWDLTSVLKVVGFELS
jgi:hypothetical protein